MSHARAPRTVVALAALAAVASMISCSDVSELVAPKTGTVHIDFTCGAIGKIGLNDGHGNSAWAFQRSQHEAIEWIVPPNVTINSITGKAVQFPIDTVQNEPHGRAPGTSYKATTQGISGLPLTKKTFAYAIDVTCHPGQPDSVRLVLDPEMIIRKP